MASWEEFQGESREGGWGEKSRGYLLFASGEKLSVPAGFIGGAIFCMEGIVMWAGYGCWPCMSEGRPACIAGDDEAEVSLGAPDGRDADFCLVSWGGCWSTG